MDIYEEDPPPDRFTGRRGRSRGSSASMLDIISALGLDKTLLSFPPTPPPKLTKCLFPGCDVMTDHHGGYCCAGHCKQHQKLRGLK